MTYLKDVAPILAKRCAGCHAAGATAPALATYEETRAWARAIKSDVLQGTMPPWSAATGLGDFSNDPRPTPVEVAMLVAWADGGTPLGSVDAAARGGGSSAEEQDAPAIVVPLPRAHPSQSAVERLQVPAVDWTAVSEPRSHDAHAGPANDAFWIGGWEYQPGNRRPIEQAVFFADGVRIGAWVPPDASVAYPPDVALHVRRGAAITAELHYRKSRENDIDAGSLRLYRGRPGREPRYRTFACGTTILQEQAEALTIAPWAEEAGAFIEVVARRPDDGVEPLVAVRRYRPAYPATYRFRTPVRLPRGTAIEVRSSARRCAAGIDLIAPRAGRAGAPRP